MNFWFRLPLRARFGIIGFSFLLAVVVLLLSWYHDPDNFSYRNAWILRYGPLVFLLWLAWSDIEKVLWWQWLIILAVMIVCAIKPPAWWLGIPAIIYILFVRKKKR